VYEVGVIDYGIGNIKSISNILDKVGASSIIITKPSEMECCKSLILPGVGSFDAAIECLELGGWVEPLNKFAKIDCKPLLGICLGMQLLTKSSQEGKRRGLGFINAETVSFKKEKMNKRAKVPHMSWNLVNVVKQNKIFTPLIESRFYFVHSYHVVCNDKKDVLTTTNYGYEFVSSFCRDNIIGVQFHPEKSHNFGYSFFIKFIKDFIV
jgi:imidazole glycerol-phosphate synthase subunit HisH